MTKSKSADGHAIVSLNGEAAEAGNDGGISTVENGGVSFLGDGIEDKERVTWDSKLQYFSMVISYAVGLGNVWRFPYLTQTHGGGAFLIPYFIMLFVEGMPVLYLELAIGQRLRLGCVGVWNEIHPFLGGLGLASAVTSFMIAIYYNAIIMWCFFYLFNSFQSPLPWAECPKTIVNNVTVYLEECDISGPTSYFWYREALDISPGIDVSGGIKWKIALCHIFSWLTIYLCVCKGIKSSGKVVYVTATFPYVVLIIFGVRGITLDGALDGLAHMFTPKMDQLMNIQCWIDAAAQIFFSFGLAFGGLIAFSSYNPMKNNVERDALVIGISNWGTAILACAVIFSVIGFKATVMYKHCIDHNIDILTDLCSNSDLNISSFCFDVNGTSRLSHDTYRATFEGNLSLYNNYTSRVFRYCNLEEDLNKGVEGTGLAFIIFTQAINEFGSSAPFWSIVFFLMLLSLGLGSEFGTIEGVTTSLYDLDLFPWFKKKWLVSGILCFLCCVIGLLFVQGSGSYWVALFDTFAGSFPLILIALCECLSVGWVFGVNRFGEEIRYMIGHQPNIFWKICWKFIAPVLIISLLLGTLINTFSKPIAYKAYSSATTFMSSAPYPWYASFLCGILVLASVMWIPVIAILRRVGILNYKHAKRFAAQMHRTTPSTVKFLGSQLSQRSEDRDSGHNSEEDVLSRESERATEFFIDEIMQKQTPTRPQNLENRESNV
uniref:Transporter n=1 Tax=Arion vulgaris TaxID=1028688 RepID=A0A0B7AQN9_9EUPU